VTAPRAVATPFQREWKCSGCGTVLGTVSAGGDLYLTAVYTAVEHARYGVIVRCSCGASRAFDNGRVIIRTGAVLSSS